MSVRNLFLQPQSVFQGGYDKLIKVMTQITWTDLITFYFCGKCQVSGKRKWAVTWLCGWVQHTRAGCVPRGLWKSPWHLWHQIRLAHFPVMQREVPWMPELSSRQAVVYQPIPLGNHFCHWVLFSSFLSSCENTRNRKTKWGRPVFLQLGTLAIFPESLMCTSENEVYYRSGDF